MKDGIVPPRLDGGVMNALGDCPGGGVKRFEFALVGVDARVDVNDFNAVDRGIEDGETLRAKTEQSKSESSDGADAAVLVLIWNLENVNGTSASSSSSSKGTKTWEACVNGT